MKTPAWLPILLLIVSGCATTRGPHHAGEPLPRWPFAGLTEVKDLSLNIYADRFLSGTCLEFDPAGGRLFTASGIPGSLSIIAVPDGTVTSVYDFGRGSVIENLVFDSGGRVMYVVASTVQPENIGEVQLARALLRVDTQLSLVVPVALKPDGYSHGLVLLPRDGLVFTLDTAGLDMSGGATLSRADLYVDELTMRKPVGNLPAGVHRRGLTTDYRQLRLFALLTEGEPASDFDPPPPPGGKAAPVAPSPVFLAAISEDSLTVQERVPLAAAAQWFGVAPTPRGVVVAGTTSRGTSLVEIDTQLMRQVAWLELPEPTTDIAVQGTTAVLPSRFGLYVVDLSFLSLRKFIPIDLQRPTEAALSPDGATACAILEDVRWPGRPALGIIDLNTGELERIVQ